MSGHLLNEAELHAFHVYHLESQILPFWRKALDPIHGGVYTGFNPLGTKLLHRDKFTWSQGRFLWLWSRLAEMRRKDLIKGVSQLGNPGDEELVHAGLTYRFLRDHAFLDNGSCAFLLTEEGRLKEMVPGQGHDISFYADCFVAMGFAEYARVAEEPEALEAAKRMFSGIEKRLETGAARSEPYPIPEGYDAHGFAMIMLNTSQAIAGAVESMINSAVPTNEYRRKAWKYAEQIMTMFCDAQHRVHEVLQRGGNAERVEQSLLLRHINPGHTLESMWFVMEEAERQGHLSTIDKASQVVSRAFDMGWDKEHGGLLRYVDLDGGQPRGDTLPGADKFERLIRDTWDMKLWWPHSEGLYACLLAYKLTGEAAHLDRYWQLHHYTFHLFPAARGEEWLQIRSRDGTPIDQVVALPVKDPYHTLRNLILIIESTAANRP